MTRATRYEQVAKLRSEGLLLREIAERVGISISYTHELLADPDGSDATARKRKQYGACEDCGAPTAYRTGGTSPKCRRCTDTAQTIWTEQKIIEAIQRFAAEHGAPPTATDWSPGHARIIGHPEKADAFYADGGYPFVSRVQKTFGSWNAGLAAAGYDPRPAGAGGRRYVGDQPDTPERVLSLYRGGMSARQIAKLLGCSEAYVVRVARNAGIARTQPESIALASGKAAA